VQALLVGPGPLFVTRMDRLVAFAARHSLPAMYSRRELVDAGGLVSYASSTAEGYRQMGIYAPYPEGRKTIRASGGAADPLRVGDQPQDRPSPWPRHPADATRPRRRGDRVKGCLAAIAHSRFWHECDLRGAPANVRCWESNGLNADVAFGPFMTHSHMG
jgi:hypothetical protein